MTSTKSGTAEPATGTAPTTIGPIDVDTVTRAKLEGDASSTVRAGLSPRAAVRNSSLPGTGV